MVLKNTLTQKIMDESSLVDNKKRASIEALF